MYNKLVWPLILIASLLLISVFIGGFITSIRITSSKSESNVEQKPLVIESNEEKPLEIKTEAFNILVLGDSIGFGLGDENNLGLGQRYAKRLEDAGTDLVNVYNQSVNGAVSSDLVIEMDKKETMALTQEADLIILSIGGNNINRLLRTQNTINLELDYNETLEQYLEDLEFVLESLRKVNQNAHIAVIGLYNPYGIEIGQDKIRLLIEWNYKTQLLLTTIDKTVYVSVYEQFAQHIDDYLYIDEFHPNNQGYEHMTNELYELLEKE